METTKKKVLAIDLDGTLLHPDPAEIVVKGRTFHQYLSKSAAEKLAQISRHFPIVIATARHAKHVNQLTEQMPETDFFGFVLENGLVFKKSLICPFPINENWSLMRQDLLLRIPSLLPEWFIIPDFESCLGFIPPHTFDEPELILKQLLEKYETSSSICVDKHKLFVYPDKPSKLLGLHNLGCHPLLAMGNDWNDLDMLGVSSYAFIPGDTHTDIQALMSTHHQVYRSPFRSHAATIDLLDKVIVQLANL